MASSAALLAGGVGLGAIVAASVMLVSQRRETRRGRSKLQLQDTDEMGFRKFVECNETLRAELEEQRQAVQEQKVAMEAYEREVLELRRKLQTAGEGGEAERPPLFKVVLTGGPCGGKTTAKSEIKARFESLGFLVLCGPEAATLLFGGGVPFPDDEAARMLLQRTILKLQMAIEDMFEEIGKNSGRPTLILLDRGALDGKAYVSDYEWELLLDDVKLTTVVLRDQVRSLPTASDGFCVLLVASECFWWLLTAVVLRDHLRRLRSASDSLRWLPVASGGFRWLPMASDGFRWFLSAPECS